VRKFRKTSLKRKINLLVSVIILFVLILVTMLVFTIIVEREFKDAGEDALSISKIVAETPAVINSFHEKNPSLTIQPITEKIRKTVGAEFIVVGNMNLIRYSHLHIDQIGSKMVGDDNDLVLKGQYSITRSKGTLGYSIRGKAPIFDSNGRQIGVVSTGFILTNIWVGLYSLLYQMIGAGALSFVVGLFGAHLLSTHIKKQLFNMEPHEIAFANQEQAAILESIREGVIAVNQKGVIVSCNREAKKYLNMEGADLIGKDLVSISQTPQLLDVLNNGIPQYDQQHIIGNTLCIVNRVPVELDGKTIGAVATFRDKMQLDQMDQRLEDISQYTDTLRSQRHEFMNKLHLISGLIQISEYDMAKEVIGRTNDEYQQTIQFYLAKIHDPAIVGILIGKTHRANELGIKLSVSPESLVLERCPHREIVVTILGNTIENALEAIQTAAIKNDSPFVTVLIKESDDQLLITVQDNGPGIAPSIKNGNLFKDGITTKGKNRGFGLSLVHRLISNVHGTITVESSPAGTLLDIKLPVERTI
jgi:two-component system, CitB family, sensor kinase